jgi:phospholipid-binding lipoprotein MlaA
MANFRKSFLQLCLVAGCALGLSACASSDYQPIIIGDMEIHDPYEDYNRAMFEINSGVDAAIIEPATILYRGVVPEVARDGIGNALDNLKSPVYLANEILQGDFEDAATVTKRFLINSTVGLAGFIDVAGMNGEEYLPEDFGQTMAVWGIDEGSYFVWPVFGGTTTRDSFGRIVDLGFDPIFWYTLNNSDKEWISYTRLGLTILDTKDNFMDAMNDLEENSLDHYAAVRAVTYQYRRALINDKDPKFGAAAMEIPNYDEEEGWDEE